jgi:hypothetical protein
VVHKLGVFFFPCDRRKTSKPKAGLSRAEADPWETLCD